MAQTKLNFDDFIKTVDREYQDFISELDQYLLDSGSKATFEEKKSGMLASYKVGKIKKALINLLFRKEGLRVRIYGENHQQYPNLLNELPEAMITEIRTASICRRIVLNQCSPKCAGYDFIVKGEHFQKCRYNCFEFLVTPTNIPYIKSLIEMELQARLG